MNLDRELATFDRELPGLLAKHQGEFVLIQGDRVDSFWKSEDDAYAAGCERFGIEPFLIMSVERNEKPLISSHPIIP